MHPCTLHLTHSTCTLWCQELFCVTPPPAGLPGNPGSATANSTVLDLLGGFDSLALCTSTPAPSSTPYSTQPPMASSTQAAAAAPSSLPPSFSDSLWDEMAVPGVGQVVVPASGQPAAPAAASQGWATFD